MNIAYFVWEYPPSLVGGLGTYATYVTKGLGKKKQNIFVFTLNPQNSLPEESCFEGIKVYRPEILDYSEILLSISDELKNWGESHKLFSDIFSYNVSSFVKFEETKKTNKYDIIVAHDWLSSIAGILSKKNSNLPFVFHIHSTEELRANLSNMIKSLEHKAGDVSDKIITVSYAMKEHLKQIGYDERKIEVVWNGIDVKEFSPKKVSKKLVEKWKERHGIKDGENVVLFVGRLTRIKGVVELIKAFEYVLKDFPNSKLIIIGKGEEKENIENLIRSLGIEEKVSMVNEWISREDLKANYFISDVAVFPSKAEPFGIVSLEAMAMEKPVVVGARGVSGFREQVIPSGDEQTGIHVNQFDPKDIAWGIKEILKDKEKAVEMGKNGRKRVLENFTIEETVRKTLEIYKSLR